MDILRRMNSKNQYECNFKTLRIESFGTETKSRMAGRLKIHRTIGLISHGILILQNGTLTNRTRKDGKWIFVIFG